MKGLMGATALTVLSTGTAFAQDNDFTAAGTLVSNTFTLNYEVNDTPQTEITNSGTPTVFNVDRLINVTVSSPADTSVVAGEDDALLPFVVVNNGNDDHAYELSVAQLGSDEFDSTNTEIVYFVDANNNGVLDNGEDAPSELQVYNDTPGSLNVPVLAPDERVFVFIRSDIPNPATPLNDGNTADLILTAATQTIGSLDADGNAVTISQTIGDTDGNSSTATDIENVFADEDGPGAEDVTDGAHSAEGSYIIISPNVSATKVVFGIPTTTATDPCGVIPEGAAYTPPADNGSNYFTPGNCVEYVIQVENAGSTEATDIVLTDVLPSNLTFRSAEYAGELVATDADLSVPAPETVCDGFPNNGTACTVTVSNATLAAQNGADPTVGYLVIRATIN